MPPVTFTVRTVSTWTPPRSARPRNATMPRPFVIVVFAAGVLVALGSSAYAIDSSENLPHDRVTFTLPVVLAAMGVVIAATAVIIRKMTLAEKQLEHIDAEQEDFRRRLRALERQDRDTQLDRQPSQDRRGGDDRS